MIDFRLGIEGSKQTIKRLNKIATTLEKHIKSSVFAEAHNLRTMITKGIRAQAPGGKRFKPLHPSTIKRKKSSKALIDKGDLIRSINVKKINNGDGYFVGVHRFEKTEDGESLANIAEIHEFGTKDGRIPERPFLRPSFDKWSKGASDRIFQRVIRLLGMDKWASIRFRFAKTFGGKDFVGFVLNEQKNKRFRLKK